MVVRGCGCCRPNLHAAGGSAAPSSPSPLQVILLILLPLCADFFFFCPLRVSIAPILCHMCCYFSVGWRSVTVCVCSRVCVRACLSQSTTASIGHHAHVCVSSTVWSHGRLQRYLSTWVLHPQLEEHRAATYVAEVAPGQWSTFLSCDLI